MCVCVHYKSFGIQQREREITSGQKSEGADDEEVCSKMLFSSSPSRGSNDFCRHGREKGVCVTLQLSTALFHIICAAGTAALWTLGLDIIVGTGFDFFLLSRSPEIGKRQASNCIRVSQSR